MEPLVSVLIPCHNGGRYVSSTLESVLGQSWPKLEIIVVDDGSTDDSAAQVARYQSRGVQLLCQEQKGAASARNRAYSACSGSLIQFLDADDLLSPFKIENQVRRIHGSVDSVATCAWERFVVTPGDYGSVPEILSRDMPAIDWLLEDARDGLGMMFPALWLIPREILERAGPWNEDLSLEDDREYFTRMLLATKNVLFVEEAVAYYRSAVPGSLSSRKTKAAWMSAFEVNRLCEKHLLNMEASDRVRRVCSLSWQQFAFSCYPHLPKLAEAGLARASQLSDARMEFPSQGLFGAASSWIGWKLARRLQWAIHGGRI